MKISCISISRYKQLEIETFRNQHFQYTQNYQTFRDEFNKIYLRHELCRELVRVYLKIRMETNDLEQLKEFFIFKNLFIFNFLNVIFIIFSPLPFSPLKPPLPSNNLTVVNESFFLFSQSLLPRIFLKEE